MRPFLGLLALLVLADCVGAPPAALPPPDTARSAASEHALAMDDGARLPLRAWLPEGTPRGVILALHGFNDYANAFKRPAEAWAQAGIATFAYDQRGFGDAPERGRWVGAERLDADLAEASHQIMRRYPGVPLFLLGESMGGAVVITAVAGATGAARPVADGIILVAPAVWGRKTMTLFERAALWAGDTFMPEMTLTGRGLDITPTDNVEVLREMSRDPLVIKETRVDTLKGLVDLMDMALDAAPRLSGTPMLLLYGRHDEVVPESPTRDFVAGLPASEAAESHIAVYEHGYHMLLRDLDAKPVLGDVAAWIGDHRSNLPSGADRRARETLLAGN